MSLIAGLNPWVAMWSQPRSTVRAIAHGKPSYGVYYLATVYALQSFFFYANWWSVGLNAHCPLILLFGVIFSPLLGLVWLYLLGGIFYVVGCLFKGMAPAAYLRTSIAWSMIPSSISLLMWLVLIFLGRRHAFIQNSGVTSSIFVSLITLIVSIWSLVLLIQSLREVQQFTLACSIFNVVLSWLLSWILVFVLFSIFRYFIVNLFV